MIDFINWCQTKKLPLPATEENTRRSGQRPQYPELYARNQLPDAALATYSATSYLDLANSKKMLKDKRTMVKDSGGSAAK